MSEYRKDVIPCWAFIGIASVPGVFYTSHILALPLELVPLRIYSFRISLSSELFLVTLLFRMSLSGQREDRK